jgi:nitrite reductase (cytochrome c-552)
MSTIRETIQKRPWLGWLLFFITIIVVFLIGLLTSNIMERRTEALYLDENQKKIDIKAYEPRNAVWGINYPLEYQTYLETSDTSFRSKHNGSALIDMLERYPNLVILWAGYGFSKDYNQARGHYYAVEDIHNTLRTGAPMGPDDGPMPATCWTCKSPDVPRLMSQIGAKDFYSGKWARHGEEVVNPIGCADCHDEETMDLRITRPALIEAFERMGKDINKSTHQEMRSLVCAQCHVEYYFNKEKPHEGVPYLTFPWDNGMKVEDMEKYYDDMGFSDWTHALSKAPMIKAQHPGYETYLTGIHAKRGVSCADCHMPYKTVGGVKFTDHKIQSPLNNIANSCQVCHRESEKELTQNVNDNMDRVISDRAILEDLLAKAHIEAKFAWDKGATEEQMQDILMDIRHAQWRWDFAAAAHGAAFHSPVEILRVIGTGIEIAQESRIKLARLLAGLGYNEEVPIPDISTKAKAQEYIGLPMEKLNSEKAEFLKEVVPEWLEQAEKRESEWPQYDMKKVNYATSELK